MVQTCALFFKLFMKRLCCPPDEVVHSEPLSIPKMPLSCFSPHCTEWVMGQD